MKPRHIIFVLIVTAWLAAFSVHAQIAGGNTEHFEKNGLAFDYPTDWKLSDNSTSDVQYIVLTSQDGTDQIAIISQLHTGHDCDFQAVGSRITDALVARIANQIHAPRPLQTSVVKTLVGAEQMAGLKFDGVVNSRGITSEVYSRRVNLRFVNLVYLRLDDDARAQAGWNSVRTTLTVAVPTLKAGLLYPSNLGDPNILNNRAVYLPKPDYPVGAKMARVIGRVFIQVIVDESGNVVSASAVSGPPLLQSGSVQAAKACKFSPAKVCGEPVRITGVITYNFAPRY